MKRFSAFVIGSILLAAPALVSAQSAFPIGPSPLQLLTGAAQLGAQASALKSGQSLACDALFSTSTVAVGQTVYLAWGSVGALDPEVASTSVSMWVPNGGSVMSFTQSGTWTYYFTFYNAKNQSATCTAKIVVTK